MDGSRDPFLEQFYTRIPASVAGTFTDEQLDAIKRAYGARTRGAHGFEIRKSFPFLWMRLYVVLLLGREKRTYDRLSTEGGVLGRAGDLLIMGITWALFLLPWLGAVYVLKTLVGLDLSPGAGGHSIFRDLIDQFSMLFS